jgi:hypothetical protein
MSVKGNFLETFLSTVANANTYLKDTGMEEYQAMNPQPSSPKISQRLPNQKEKKNLARPQYLHALQCNDLVFCRN